MTYHRRFPSRTEFIAYLRQTFAKEQSVVCPTCGAIAGMHCVSSHVRYAKTPGYPTRPHKERRVIAKMNSTELPILVIEATISQKSPHFEAKEESMDSRNLYSDMSLLDAEDHKHPAFVAFELTMKGHAYGRGPLHQAWYFFKAGWEIYHNANSSPLSRASSDLSDARIVEWANGRPSNPITSDGVYMAMELRRRRNLGTQDDDTNLGSDIDPAEGPSDYDLDK